MNWREDKTLATLSFFTIFFTTITLLIVWLRNNDGQSFTLFSTLAAGAWGALSKHLTEDKVAPEGSTTETSSHRVTQVPPAPQVEVKP